MQQFEEEVGGKSQALIFSGKGGEYFRIWIVNLILSIITLGIFSAWAKVRRLKYFYGHTQLDGHGFDYHAKPVKILIGRIIAISLLAFYSLSTSFMPGYAFYIVTLLTLMIPFIIVTASAFSMRNTSYRNIRFHFKRDFSGAYKTVAVPVLIALLVAGGIYSAIPELIGDPENESAMPKVQLLPQIVVLAFIPFLPWLDFKRSQFVISHTQYGKVQAAFSARAWDFYAVYLKLLGFILLLIICLVAVITALISSTGMQGSESEIEANSSGVVGLMLVAGLIFYSLLFFISAWFASRRNNLIRNHTTFGNNRMHGSFKARGMAWVMISNVLATMVTLGIFFPWAAIRMARYNAEHTYMAVEGLNETVAEVSGSESAIGEELGDFFDIDVGF